MDGNQSGAEKIFILVDSQEFKKKGIDFLIIESFYVCKCDRNIFTQRLIKLPPVFVATLAIQNTARFVI